MIFQPCTQHYLINEIFVDLIERTFYKKDDKLYLACNDKKAFFTSADHHRGYNHWSCHNVSDALSLLLDNIQKKCWYANGYKLCYNLNVM